MNKQGKGGDRSLAARVLHTARALNPAGLNRGAAGNVSARCDQGFLITPSGMAWDACTEADMVLLDGQGAVIGGERRASSEWRFHRDIYAARPQTGAVIHCHAPFAVALACQKLEIPPFHYMIARFGGDSVRCADYAVFGSQRLSDAILVALKERNACLMAHHGMTVTGDNLEHALELAIELEALCEQYWRVLQLGAAQLLTAEQMSEVMERFSDYGKQH